MASNNNTSKRVTKALIEQFTSITGADEKVGRNLLEACAGNLEMAIGMQLDGSAVGAAGQSSGGASPADSNSSSAPQPDDSVRAPIPQKRDVLVEQEARAAYPGQRNRRRAARSVFDGFRDFQAEARAQQRRTGSEVSSNKLKTLEDLFRPPVDLMFKGSFHSARNVSCNKNRWMLVNIQNTCEFACQLLNRDVWANSAIKSIIKEHFVFWQVYNDSEEGKKYMQFYKVSEWPYVSVIDPRTGEKLVVWNQVDPVTFSDLVTDFLAVHPSPDGSTTSPVEDNTKLTVMDASEDSQFEAAIEASLSDMISKPCRRQSNSSKGSFPSDDSFDEDCDLETFTDSSDSNASSSRASRTKKNSTSNKSNAQPTKKSSPTGSKVKSTNKRTHKDNSSTTTSKRRLKPSSASDSDKPISPSSNSSSSPKSKKGTKKRSPKMTKKTTSRAATKRSKRLSSDVSNSDKSHSEMHTDDADYVPEASSSQHSAETKEESWKEYLGNDSDSKTDLMIRFPDGQRKQLTLPCSSKLFALVRFVISHGFSNERYELVTTFPRRKLSHLDFEATLTEIGLPAQETVFVQER